MLLRTRIIVFVLLVVAAVTGLVFAAGNLRQAELDRRIAQLTLLHLEQAWTYTLNDVADQLAGRLGDLGLDDDHLTEAIRLADQHALATLAQQAFATSGLPWLDAFDDNGALLWSSGERLDGTPLVGASRLADLAPDAPRVSGARMLPDGSLGVVGAVALVDPGDQRLLGGLVAALPLDVALKAFQASMGGELFVSNRAGQLIFGRDEDASPWRQAREGLATGRRDLVVLHQNGHYTEAAQLPVADLMGGHLASLVLVRDVTAAVEERQLGDRALMWGFLTLFTAALLVLYLFLRRHFEVLDDAVAALHDLSRGQRSGYVELPHGNDEIGRIAAAVETFGLVVAEVARVGTQRERRQRRQQRFIRRQMEQLAATLENEARKELLDELSQMEAAASDPESPQSKGMSDELGLIALGFSRLATKVGVQQVQLTQMVRDLREALEDKRKLISLQQELEIAANMQASILPRQFPELSMLDISASMDPAKEVGGDFYDIFEVREGLMGVVVADVSGKGIPAAFFMLISRTMLRTVAREGGGPAETLSRLNNLLAAENEQSMFVTVFYAEIDLATGLVTYCSGGHNPPFVTRAQGGVDMVDPTVGIALAMFPDMAFSDKTLTLRPGDTLFMYTDGVNEAFAVDQRMYGTDRLQEILVREGPPTSAASALSRVLTDLGSFTAGADQSDDITAVVVHWRG